nr:reverse transcriptase domain-containing protein [Tanacetum cinerariifolium]
RKFKDTSKNNQNQQQNKKQNTGRAYTAGSGDKKPYGGSKPLCSKCNYHYDGHCVLKCHKCNRVGHLARDYRSTTNANTAKNQKGTRAGKKPTCFECAAQGHFKREFPKLKNNNRSNQGGNGNAPAKVFNVIIGMDWLAKYHVVVVGVEKIIRIPWGNETLIVCEDESDRGNETRLNIISCTKMQKYMLKGCHVFLAHLTIKETEDKSEKKRLEDNKKEHKEHLKLILELLKKEELYAKFSKCEFWIPKKKAKLLNEWERFTSNEGEWIESYYHLFLKLMNDLKRNKHFPQKFASNLKFLNNLQPEWSRHVTIVHQTKDLHTTDYTQLYDFLKYNQKEVDELKAERLAKIQDPLALMANLNNPYAFPTPHQDQPSYNQNYMQQPMPNPKDISDPTTTMNVALALMAKAFKLNYTTPTNNNQRISSNPRNRQIAQPGMNMGQDRQMQMVGGDGENQFRQYTGQNNGLIGVPGNGNQNGNGNLVAARAEGNAAGQDRNQIRCYNCRGVGHFARNCTVRPRRRDAAYLQTQLLIAQKKEAGIQIQAEEFDLMAVSDKASVYDSNGSTEVHDYENCDDNEILNMFTQEEQYTELLKSIPKQHQVPQNDNDVIFEVTSVKQSEETVEQQPANFEETRALYDSLYQNLAIEVDKVKSVNRKLKETNADLTTELARFKNQEKCFEISQEKYDKLERYLNKQLLKEKSTVSFLHEEKKKLKSDFKTREDELLGKQIQLEKKIKESNNILVKTGQSIQTIHKLSPKPDSFYHTEQKMALGYQNPFYLKQAQKKQQSLYDGKVLLEKQDPPVVHDSEETLQLAQ